MIVLITISENNTIEIQLSVLTPKNSRSLIFVSEDNKNCVQYYAFKCNKNILKCAFEIPKSICLNDLIS